MRQRRTEKVNWFVDQRKIWVTESLRVFGYVTRDHLVRKFSISPIQASRDLDYFVRNGVITFNPKLKRYEVR